MIKYLKSEIGLAGIYIVFDGSAYNEIKKGTSHLIEHIICKNYDDMLPELSSYNIESNAYTSNNEVVFLFRGLEESLSKFSQVLVDRILSGMTCTEEQYNNEKSTVLQEYADNFNNQSYGHYNNLMREYANFYAPIGLKQHIEEFTFEYCKREIDLYFRKPSRIIVVGKDITVNCSLFSNPIYFDEVKPIMKREVVLENVVKGDKTSVMGIFKNWVPFQNRHKFGILCMVLNDGLESPLFQEIREKRGLSYFSWLMDNMIGNNTVGIFGACTTNDRKDELVKVYEDFFENVDQYISEDRFKIIHRKLILEAKEQTILKYEHCKNEITNGKDMYTVEDIQNITFPEVFEMSKYLKDFYISIH